MVFDEEITNRLAILGFGLVEQTSLTDKYLQIATLEIDIPVTFDKIVEVEKLLGYDFLGCIPDLSGTLGYGAGNVMTFKKILE